MNILKNYIFEFIVALLVFAVGFYVKFPFTLSIAFALTAGTYIRILKTMFEMKKMKNISLHYLILKEKLIPLYIMIFIGIVLLGWCVYAIINFDSSIHSQVLLYVTITFVLNISLMASIKQSQIFVTEDSLYITKLVKFEDIIRFTKKVDKRNKPVNITLTYIDKDLVREVYLNYNEKIETFLINSLPKRKKSY